MAATDARPVPRKNAAFRFYFAIRKNDGTLITGWTGADSEVSIDGAGFSDCTNEATEIGSSGCGYIDLTSSEMNGDAVMYKLTVTNTGALTLVVNFFPEEAGDYRADVTHFGGSAGTFASGRPEVNTSHAAGTAWNSGAIGAATLAADTLTAAKVAADVGTEIGTAVWATTTRQLTSAQTFDLTGNITGNLSGSVGSVGAGGITASSIAADAITAAKVAADVTTELQSGLATAANLATVASYIDTEMAAVLAVTSKLDTALESDGSGGYQFTTLALENGPSGGGGGGGGTDWTTDEKAVIRAVLGIPGSGTTPADPTTGILDTIRDTVVTVAGYLDTEIAAILADTNELQTDWVNGGRLDLLVDGIKAKTDQLVFTKANELDVNVQSVNGATVAGTGASGDEWGPV